MADTVAALKLTCEGAMKLLNAAMTKASAMGVPQCISVVDAGGHLLAFARMDGAFALSVDTSLMKAKTAASYGKPTGDIAAGLDLKRDCDARQAHQPAGRLADHRRRACDRRHRRGLGHRRAGPRGGECGARRLPRRAAFRLGAPTSCRTMTV
jgi:Haem-degrading